MEIANKLLIWIWRKFKSYWRASWWHKAWLILVAAVLLCLGTMYSVAQWYIHSQTGPYVMGVSFIPDYASYLGLNPNKTLTALENIGVKHFRFVSYWSDIEPTKGHYDFSELDQEFASADAHHASITLAIGLRQPRWPECHAPGWVDTSQPYQQWLPGLEQFMTKVVNRYKNNPALVSYQLENEFFGRFGDCSDHSRARLISEYKLVRRLDPKRTLIINRSNTGPAVSLGQPVPDEFGMAVYRRVWSPPIGRYIEYPMPAWYYAYLAGATKILTGHESIIHEMQAEPWPPNSQTILGTSLKVQNQTLNANILRQRFAFARATGIRTVYFWGSEYWYYRLVKLHDPSVWNVAKQEFSLN